MRCRRNFFFRGWRDEIWQRGTLIFFTYEIAQLIVIGVISHTGTIRWIRSVWQIPNNLLRACLSPNESDIWLLNRKVIIMILGCIFRRCICETRTNCVAMAPRRYSENVYVQYRCVRCIKFGISSTRAMKYHTMFRMLEKSHFLYWKALHLRKF